MPWLIPENELDVQQRAFLDSLFTDRNSNRFIEGFPGSGKTILLLYAVERLKRENPDVKIVFIEFTHALIDMLKAALKEMHRGDVPVMTYYDFEWKMRGRGIVWNYVMCDEVQDVPRRVLEDMVQHGRNIIIAGDPNQSIYDEDPQWRLPVCTRDDINEVIFNDNKTLDSSFLHLNIMHRLTRRIVDAVNSFFPEMKIMSGRSSMMKTNTQIRLWKCRDSFDEAKHIMETATQAIRQDYTAAILLPTHKLIERFATSIIANGGKRQYQIPKNGYGKPDYSSLNSYFNEHEMPIQYLGNKYGSLITPDNKICLMTYHSSKGLDFDLVFLPFCDSYTCDNRLFMVAMTRSRQDLYISYSIELDYNSIRNDMNSFVNGFKGQCNFKDWTQGQSKQVLSGGTNTKGDNSEEDLFGF